MTDKEMLELAAKTAGYRIDGWDIHGTPYQDGLFDSTRSWNPLTNDGDCFRMETELGIEVVWFSKSVLCRKSGINWYEFFTDHNGDKNAARRMASLRVAAEKGKEMSGKSFILEVFECSKKPTPQEATFPVSESPKHDAPVVAGLEPVAWIDEFGTAFSLVARKRYDARGYQRLWKPLYSEAQVAALQAELAECKRDAERYRKALEKVSEHSVCCDARHIADAAMKKEKK